ncbi:MAG: transcriptional regulator [Terriglobales bacterium]|jgi:DNA-binding transcriptional ArsR family regulator
MTESALTEELRAVPFPDRLIHEPARLAILAVVSSCASADFIFLQAATGISKGNLSVQLTNLEQAGLVVITKEIIEKKMRTTVSLSKRGRSEIDEYWKTMDAIRGRMEGEKRRRPTIGRRSVPSPAY